MMMFLPEALLIACFGLLTTVLQFNAGEEVFVHQTQSNILSREGCMEVLTCFGVSMEPPRWRKRPDKDLTVTQDLSNVSNANSGLLFWKNTLVFQSLKLEDTGVYSCDLLSGSESTALTFLLTVKREIAVMASIPNVDLSLFDAGEIMQLQCSVDTCLSDIVIQFFRRDELLESSISREERGWNGTLQFRVAQDLVGDYVCQAMSDEANVVLRQNFSVSGTPN